jgi:hypothetical protein
VKRYTADKYKMDGLPMGVGGMRSGRKFDFLVGALERNIEPGEECVDIWRIRVRTRLNISRRVVYSHRECKSGKRVQQMQDPPSLPSEGQYAAEIEN